MLPSDAVKVTPKGDELANASKAESLTISLNEKVVDVNNLPSEKKSKLIDFLSIRYALFY